MELKISDLQTQLDSLFLDESDLTALKAQVEETSTALTTAQADFAAKNWDQAILALEVQISTYEEEINAVQRDLSSTSAQSDLRAKIDVLRGDIARKTQARTSQIRTQAAKFKKYVDAELGENSSDSQVNVLLRRRQDELEEAEKVLEGRTKEITGLEAKLTAVKEQFKERRKEKDGAYAKIMGSVELDEIDMFPNSVKDYEDAVADMKLYPKSHTPEQ